MILKLFEAAPEAWIGLIGAIFGALVTLLGSLVANRYNAKQALVQLQYQESMEGRKVKKDRLEELYVLTSIWESAYIDGAQSIVQLASGDVGLKDYFEAHNEVVKLDNDFLRASMLCEIYGEETDVERKDLLAAISRFESLRSAVEDECISVNKKDGKFVSSLESPEKVRKYAEDVLKKFRLFKTAISILVKRA